MRREEGRRVGGGPEGRRVPLPWVARSRLIYGFIPKIEELVDRSKDKIGTDVAYRKIIAMGYRVGAVDPAGRRGVAGCLAGWAAVPAWIPGADVAAG